MYGDLRAELRQRNVAELERTLNETFELVYGNDAYSHIELDGEYVLTVYQKDGEPLDPEQLSGGERALFSSTSRCAVRSTDCSRRGSRARRRRRRSSSTSRPSSSTPGTSPG